MSEEQLDDLLRLERGRETQVTLKDLGQNLHARLETERYSKVWSVHFNAGGSLGQITDAVLAISSIKLGTLSHSLFKPRMRVGFRQVHVTYSEFLGYTM